jgi:hypothetical protein
LLYTAAKAALLNGMQRNTDHYTRGTGKLSKAPHGIYADSNKINRASSTIYSVENSDELSKQYPLGCITETQRSLVSSFISGLCNIEHPSIDNAHRAIHTVATWRQANTTIFCTAVQPHVTNAIIHIKGIPTHQIVRLRDDYIAVVGGAEPSLNTHTGCPQPQGSLAVPFTDYMLARKVVSESNIQWSNTVLSKTQLVFIVVSGSSAFECVLTHRSCAIMAKYPAPDAIILAPSSRSESYSFRRLSLTHGKGSGPSVTVHRSGTMQYQGGRPYIQSLLSNFRSCIHHIMASSHSSMFINSLGITRDLCGFMPEM